MKTKKTTWLMKAAIIVAVIVIPLAYSLFYLGAFWDPYGKLNQLPVAVVNEDRGAVVNGQQRNLGTELVQELKSNNSIKWVEADADDAAAGLKGTKYYAVLTIPSGFSGDIASAKTTDKHPATITYSANEKGNFLAAQILNRAVLEIKEQLETKVDEEITTELVSELQATPGKLQDLSNGLGDMADGSTKLSNGLKDLSKGQNSLVTGVLQLDNGLNALLDGSSKLSQNIGALESGIAQTKTSVMSALPSMNGAAGQTASLTESLQKLATGAQEVSDGLSKASAGTSQLTAAATSNTSGLPALAAGIEKADAGAAKLSTGVNAYVDGVNGLIDQNKALMTKLNAIYASASMTDSQKSAAAQQVLAAAAAPENQSQLQKLAASGSQLKSGASDIATGTGQLKASERALTDLSANLLKLDTSLQKLSDGASQVTGGVKQMQAGAASLGGISDSLGALTTALDRLDAGAKKLYDGSLSLTAGLQEAKTGSNQLVGGGQKLQDGTAQLQEGVTALSDGISSAKSSVDNAIDKANNDLKATQGLSDFASKPVTVNESPINPVPNYGTAFGPYFISLSLYVGALIMFVGIYLDGDEKIPMLSRDSGRRFVRVGVFAVIGIVQAVGLALIVRYGLGIHLANPAAYYLSCILTSLVFIAIVQFFMVCLKDAGKFLSMLLLILQLTANGGTFPMETVPKFFNVISPYMPMTYSVRLFKETISGYDSKAALTSVLILAAIGIFFTVLTMIFTAGSKIRQEKNTVKIIP
jgi:putative membrane protein